jgi:hypothetical protein
MAEAQNEQKVISNRPEGPDTTSYEQPTREST